MSSEPSRSVPALLVLVSSVVPDWRALPEVQVRALWALRISGHGVSLASLVCWWLGELDWRIALVNVLMLWVALTEAEHEAANRWIASEDSEA